MVVDRNYFYDTPALNQGYNELGFLWTPRSNDAVVTNNYFIGGKQGIDLERWDTLTFQNNTIYVQSGDESMLITGSTQSTAGYLHSNNKYYGSGSSRSTRHAITGRARARARRSTSPHGCC